MSGWIAAERSTATGSCGRHVPASRRRPGGPPMRGSSQSETPAARPIARLFRLFRWYAAAMRASFPRRRVSRGDHAGRSRRPPIVVLNHPSWWDPLIGLVLTGALPDGRHIMPRSRRRGSPSIGSWSGSGSSASSQDGGRRDGSCDEPGHPGPSRAVLWSPPRAVRRPAAAPAALRPGRPPGHRLTDYIVPLALEYPFWDERMPGSPRPVRPPPRDRVRPCPLRAAVDRDAGRRRGDPGRPRRPRPSRDPRAFRP